MNKLLVLLAFAVSSVAGAAWGASMDVTMRQVDSNGVGDVIGTVVFEDTPEGLKIMPDLHGLAEGQHGFHVHEIPDCGPMEKDGAMVPAMAAGSHLDPEGTGRHEGPTGQGHLGDLPVLHVDAAGRADGSVLAPRLALSDLIGRTIMIHSGGDNYADVPDKLGGGGSRVACGVVVE